jgi:hypothetical protein
MSGNLPLADLHTLSAQGFQIEFHSHARAILAVDFPEALRELESALQKLTIPIEEIIAGGGGEAKGTQRLRKALSNLKWLKTKFEIKKTINGRERESISLFEQIMNIHREEVKIGVKTHIPFASTSVPALAI